jgi:HK97 family phage major capsid protein
MTNQQLIEKADLALSDLSAGGLLTTEQENAFFRKLIIWPTILQDARVVRMGAPKREVNKIGFGSRVLHKATATTAPTSGQRSKPDLSRVTLDTVEFIAEVDLPYTALEDNIEGQSMADTIMELLTQRVATDIEEIILLGDVGSGDPDLAALDGILKQSTSNIVNAGSSSVSSTHFRNIVRTMPDQYLRNRNALRHYVSMDVETDLRDRLGQRATQVGDTMLTGLNQIYLFGIPVTPAPMMPNANTLTTDPKNIIVGFHREVMVEVDKDIRQRQWIIVLTLRMDVKLEEEPALVKGTNLALAA